MLHLFKRKKRDPEGESQEQDPRLERRHKILVAREVQLRLNSLLAHGGQPYIDRALTRMPSESDASWWGESEKRTGKTILDTNIRRREGVKPRRLRAHLVNYAKRIIQKINQFVFSQEIERQGIDPDFKMDATITGLTVDKFMEAVSAAVTAQQWAWIQVDRSGATVDPQTGEGAALTIQERSGDRVFWKLWEAVDVVDWQFDDDGTVKWLITEEINYVNDTPDVAAENQTLYTIWEKGKGTRIFLNEDNGKPIREENFQISDENLVPFIPVGLISPDPHWFDEVERIMASILNLDSANNENLTKAAFPQVVIPASLIESIARMTERTNDEALELVRGLEFPFMEPNESKGITRIITPAASDLLAIPTEISRLRKELYETVGLAMNTPESRQIMSAESKAWDNLDPSSTLRARAIMMEEAETKAVAMSVSLDSKFKLYAPQYPRQFDLPNIADTLKAITEIEQGNLTPTLAREIAKIKVVIIDKMIKIKPEKKEEIMKEIDEIPIEDLIGMTAPGLGVGAGDLDEDEEDAA